MQDTWPIQTPAVPVGSRHPLGVSTVGVPVRSVAGTGIAAITVAATMTRMREKRVREVLPMLQAAANEFGKLLRQ